MKSFKKAYQLSLLALSVIAQLCTANNFKTEASAFLDKHCVKCHGPDKQKGDVQLDTINYDLSDTQAALLWQDVVDMINIGDMPPAKEPRPDKALQDKFIAITQAEINLAANQSIAHAGIRIRRLSQSAMDNALEDLIGMKFQLSKHLPQDPEVEGFDNLAQTMALTGEFLAQVQENAQVIVNYAMTDKKNPKKTRVFEKNKLIIGNRGSSFGQYKASFSSFSLANYGIWPKTFIAPFPGTYKIAVDAFGMDNRHQFPKEKIQKSPNARRFILSPELPDDARREVIIMASLPRRVTNPQKHASKFTPDRNAREVGRFYIGPKIQRYTVPVELHEGEMITIIYGSAPRQSWTPIAKTQKGDIPVGEALYLNRIAVDGPIQAVWPSKAHAALIQEQKNTPQANSPSQRIQSFASKAFRRPVNEEILNKYLSLYENNVKDIGKHNAMSLVLEAILCSPRFLLNYDNGNNDNWALINRLSYFLWDSMPDETLFSLAASGEIRNQKVIKQQVLRMIADPKAQRFVKSFVGQWLGIKHLGTMPPDDSLFPNYTKSLEEAMRKESELYFLTMLYGNLPIKNFIDSNFTVLNQELADHYQIDGIKGANFRVVNLDKASPRGGVLSHASVLTTTSDGTRTSPVIRGIWVLERILGTPPNPPPPDVEPLEPDVRGATTIREMLAKHRKVETCNECHRSIDPWGFAMENFDPVGNWRSHYGGHAVKNEQGQRIRAAKHPIDSAAIMSDGTNVNGFKAMKAYLAQKEERFATAFTEKLMTYALGYHVGPKERLAVDNIVANSKDTGYSLADLILGICLSEPFVNSRELTIMEKLRQKINWP